jgi:hypothetical protein
LSQSDIFNNTRLVFKILKSTRPGVEGTQSIIFPLATLEAASHRISKIYKNIIFGDVSEVEGLSEERPEAEEPAREGPSIIMLCYKIYLT